MKTSWKMTLTLRMLENNLMKSKFELKTTDNQRKPNQLTKYPLLACAPMHRLAGHFLLKPAASNAFSRRGPPQLACVMSTPVPRSKVQSTATQLPDVIITLLSHLNCPAEQFKFDKCNNPRCPHQIAELCSHSIPSV
jgi:hypothetical protein